jgi:hypothetical protein
MRSFSPLSTALDSRSSIEGGGIVTRILVPATSPEDWKSFLAEAGINEEVSVAFERGINLSFAWVHGWEKYLSS